MIFDIYVKLCILNAVQDKGVIMDIQISNYEDYKALKPSEKTPEGFCRDCGVELIDMDQVWCMRCVYEGAGLEYKFSNVYTYPTPDIQGRE